MKTVSDNAAATAKSIIYSLRSEGNIQKYTDIVKKYMKKGKLRRLVLRLAMYVLLINFSFVFLYPFLYMISTALKGASDLNDIYVVWIPRRGIEWNNFKLAFRILHYVPSFMNSVLVTSVCTLGHIMVCSLVAYGFARIPFKGRNMLFILVMFTLVVPAQVIVIPTYILNARLGLIGTYLPILIPSFLGMGLRGGLFIFIFRQIFLGFPYELEEAARIDGCGLFMTYLRIILPISKPAILVSSILSFVWHWNDYYEPTMYISKAEMMLLPMQLPGMRVNLSMVGDMLLRKELEKMFTQGTIMAGTFLAVIPVLIVYLFIQKRFMESVERTGIVG